MAQNNMEATYGASVSCQSCKRSLPILRYLRRRVSTEHMMHASRGSTAFATRLSDENISYRDVAQSSPFHLCTLLALLHLVGHSSPRSLLPFPTRLHVIALLTICAPAMSLSDLRVLPRLYDGLASPPLSPINTTTPPTSPPLAGHSRVPSRRTSFAHPGTTPIPPVSPLALNINLSRRTSFAHPISTPIPPVSPLALNTHLSRRTSFVHPISTPISPVSPFALNTHHQHLAEPSPFFIPPAAHPPAPIEPHSFSRSLQPSRIPQPLPELKYLPEPQHLPEPLYLEPVTPDFLHTADSLTREKKGKMPALSHLLSVGNGRVLALAADERYVYAGCQSADNEVMVSFAL